MEISTAVKSWINTFQLRLHCSPYPWWIAYICINNHIKAESDLGTHPHRCIYCMLYISQISINPFGLAIILKLAPGTTTYPVLISWSCFNVQIICSMFKQWSSSDVGDVKQNRVAYGSMWTTLECGRYQVKPSVSHISNNVYTIKTLVHILPGNEGHCHIVFTLGLLIPNCIITVWGKSPFEYWILQKSTMYMNSTLPLSTMFPVS